MHAIEKKKKLNERGKKQRKSEKGTKFLSRSHIFLYSNKFCVYNALLLLLVFKIKVYTVCVAIYTQNTHMYIIMSIGET